MLCCGTTASQLVDAVDRERQAVSRGPNLSLAAQDREYTAALRALRDSPTEQEYARLQVILNRFIQKWPVQNSFPLMECGLSLEDIACLNLVRCRTGVN